MNATDQQHVNSLARLMRTFGEDIMLAAVHKATGQHVLLLSADELGLINWAVQSHSDSLRVPSVFNLGDGSHERAVKDIAMCAELSARVEKEFER